MAEDGYSASLTSSVSKTINEFEVLAHAADHCTCGSQVEYALREKELERKLRLRNDLDLDVILQDAPDEVLEKERLKKKRI